MYTYVKWHPLFLLMCSKMLVERVQWDRKKAIFASAKLR